MRFHQYLLRQQTFSPIHDIKYIEDFKLIVCKFSKLLQNAIKKIDKMLTNILLRIHCHGQ